MNKLNLHTPNLSNKNYTALVSLFPNAVTETIDENGVVIRAIDTDVLAQEINTHIVSGKEERYQFTWPDKKKAVLLANSPIAATLRPCREESVDFDNTENLYIEGDNLDVLKMLRETYLNRVKMIYIDPPYNTGNDFIYEDDFTEDTGEFLTRDYQYNDDGNRMVRNLDSNGRFHTDWLNMIYPRLRVARDLLTDDGVIFISVDDGETAQIRKICDEVFGEGNFVSCIAWESKTKSQNTKDAYNKLQPKIEHIFIYSKKCPCRFNLISKGQKEYNMFDDKGRYREYPLEVMNAGGIRGRETMIFPVEGISPPQGKQWQLGLDTITEYKNRSDLFVREGKVILKMRPEDERTEITEPFWAFFSKEIGTTESAKKELSELLEAKNIFETVKPIELIKRLIFHSTSSDDIILDFFSGSATTAHAVMQLNAEDVGKRKFIMVQLPEVCAEDSEAAKAGYKNICEIGKERIRRAGKKIVEESPLDRAELDIGFRVLKLDSSNMKDIYYTPQETVSEDGAWEVDLDGFIDNIKPDRSAEDLLFQVMLDLGIPLSAKIEKRIIGEKTVHFVDSASSDHSQPATSHYLIACFNRVTDEIVTEIAKNKPYYAVFRDSSFYNDATLVNFEQIFKTYSPTTVRKVL